MKLYSNGFSRLVFLFCVVLGTLVDMVESYSMCQKLKRNGPLLEGGKGGIVILFHAQILTKFTRHVLNQSLLEKPQGNQTQIIHESCIPHEINHASHAFRYSRITFLFK